MLVVMSIRRIIDQDGATALKNVSAELDQLVKNRIVVAFTDADKMRYEALCQREQELICPDRGDDQHGRIDRHEGPLLSHRPSPSRVGLNRSSRSASGLR
jgi:hypothetical protein